MEEKTVRLYTRQNDKTVSQLERNGRIINNRIYVQLHFGDIAPFFLKCYDWFTEEAVKYLPKPDDVHAPIWCSISKENCLKPIPGTVVYVLDVPESQVIYFDDLKWDYVLNQIYLPEDEEDQKAYNEHLRKMGIESGFEIMSGKYKGKYPEEEKRIMESWKRAFKIDNWSIWNVCGNLWEIKKEWVKKIVYPGESIE